MAGNMENDSIEVKDRYSVEFPPIIIELLKNGGDVTYAQVGEQYEKMYPDRLDRDDMKRSLTARSYYPSLKKAFASVRSYLKEYKDVDVISDGKTRGTKYKLEKDSSAAILDEVLEESKKKAGKLRQKTLLRLIENSLGLIPGEWMAESLVEIHKMMDREKKTYRKIIEFDSNEKLRNLHLIPALYKAIENKQVLRLVYHAHFSKDKYLVFCPCFLKEWNNRWFVFGHSRDESDSKADPKKNDICALDRIKEIRVLDGEKYVEPEIDYVNYFEDMIGVSRTTIKRKTDGKIITFAARKIMIEVRGKDARYTYERLLSKPLHKSQVVEKEFDEEEGTALVSLTVVPNNELMGRLLEYGPNIRVVDTKENHSFYKWFSEHVRQMAELYPEVPCNLNQKENEDSNT